MASLFPDEPPLEHASKRPGLLYAFAVVHGVVGVLALSFAIQRRLDGVGAWLWTSPGALLLIANAIGLAFVRGRAAYKVSLVLIFLFRVGGAISLMVGAMAMRQDMDGAWTVMGVSLAIIGWGFVFDQVLDDHDDAFTLPPAAAPSPAFTAALAAVTAAGPPADWLHSRLERGLTQTSAGFKRGGLFVSGVFAAIALLYILRFGQWAIAAFIAGFGALIALIMVLAIRRTSPERMAPVLAALRDAPQRINLVRHYTTGDSGGMFEAHWIEVKTADHRLLVKANHDWESLLAELSRRCPTATVKR